MGKRINLAEAELTALHTRYERIMMDGEPVLRVVKTEKEEIPDINSYVRIGDTEFHNGIIEADVLSRLLPDAPAHARGFIGIAFRISEDDAHFESFYIRPTNGRCDDPVRKNHAVQYFSYPDYPYTYFRDHGIAGYEAPADIGLNEWIHLRAEIRDETGVFSVNGLPVLKISRMKGNPPFCGSVGLFTDIGTDGYFRNLRIEND